VAKRRSKTPEELADDNARTTPLGLFNTAEAYRSSAAVLEQAKLRGGHADSPIRFLYFHAIELYLKALLRQEHNVDAIKSSFGHSIRQLVPEAERLGLCVADEDREIFSLMMDTDAVIEARYVRTGAKTWPTLEGLNRTCASIREQVGKLLREANIAVWM